ncbi:ornithine cyclodeaminase family protein [Halomarina rubra]|uniref:Ornithine cyclodeaminase family protein n=1 Tax=Halomarina rubra TaxID=2071873 RepID=A0ABD6AXF7_9EURY|nr:ornithine cyclodeaminase family protein [Halomarina rubra]
MVLTLSDEDVDAVLDLPSVADAVERALVEQTAGNVERPHRPHYPIGEGIESEEALGTGLAMPAYIHGDPYFSTKLASVFPGNDERGLPSLHAQLVLGDAGTGEPLAFLNATRLTNARTGCIGGLAARELATDPVRVGVVGAGAQARWQTRAIAALCDVASVSVYSPSDSKHDCAAALREDGLDATAVASAEEAVEDATVVVTATTSSTPVFPAEALSPGTLVVAVGAYTAEMQELEPAVFDRAARVFADVPEEVAAIGDVAATDLGVDDLVPMGSLFDGSSGRESAEEVLVVDSVGSAVFDVAAASVLYDAAHEAGLGTELSL